MLLGSRCEYKTAGPAGGPQIAYCVAHFGSGQQVVFEERGDDEPETEGEAPEDAAKEEPECNDEEARASPRTRLSIYLQSREAFRSAFMACGSAGCLTDAHPSWEECERAHRFVAKLQGSRSGASPVVSSRVEIEIRSITHPLCPQGTGRRPGSGRMPGGFGAAAKELIAAKTSSASSSSSSEGVRSSASGAGAARRPPKPPMSASKAQKPSPSRGLSHIDANALRQASPKPSKASPLPVGDGRGVKRR